MKRMLTIEKKEIGYFGCLYANHLAENYPDAWKRLLRRDDAIEVLKNIGFHCHSQMQLYLEIVGKDNLNKHKLTSRLARTLYDKMIEMMKDMVFEDCLDLLAYAEWMDD